MAAYIVHFSKRLGDLSSAGPEVLAFGSHCSAKFQLIFGCFTPNLKCKDSENIRTYCIDMIVSNHIKSNKESFFGDTVHVYLKEVP